MLENASHTRILGGYISRKARPMEASGIFNINLGPTSVLSGKLIPSRLEDTHPKEQVLHCQWNLQGKNKFAYK